MTRNKQVLLWTSVVTLTISAWLLIMAFFGYGHLVLSVPPGSTVVINGHPIPNSDKPLKLRSGTYHISTTSARYFSAYRSVRVSAFRTTHYSAARQQRSPESIAYSAAGVSAAGLPPVSNAHWVGDTWVVEEVGISTPLVLVAHYEHTHWNKVYSTGDSLDASKLPPDVVQLVNSLEESIRASLN